MTDCPTKIQRASCIQCALKHLSQAWVLFLESHKGYPDFYWLSMGHMAEAEDELATDHPIWAQRIREERTAWQMDEEKQVPFRELIIGLVAYDDELATKQLEELNL